MRSGKLSKMLSMTSRSTEAEIYLGEDLMIHPVKLRYTGVEEDERSFVLMQNEPNPFKESTVIGFEFPESGAVTLTLSDDTGSIVLSRTIEGRSGYNELILKENEVKVSGILYYTVQSIDHTDTKKMISIK